MASLTKKQRERVNKTLSVVTSLATILWLSGVLYLLPLGFANAAVPGDYGLKEGDTVSATGSDDPDVYIVNADGYKRLFLNPVIFNFYGHLGGFANVKSIAASTRDAFPTSGLFRNCETNDPKVYGVEVNGEDTGMLHWVNTSGSQAVADDPNFFQKVFCVNNNEFNWYSKGTDYTSVSQVPNYTRTPGTTPTPTGPLSVSLAPGNPVARTITTNALGVEFLRVRFSGTGTINAMTFKRLGPGNVDEFGDTYVYDGATRLVSGKSLSSSTGEVSFLNLKIDVNGTKDISLVADMSTATAGNVNYFQLVTVGASGTVSGFPLNGSNLTTSGAASGTLDIAKVGAVSDPTVGQKGAIVSEFKITANTEAASIKRLTIFNGGTIKPSDLKNPKLQAGTEEWLGSVTSSGYLVFDMGSGLMIAKGGNKVFKVLVDVGGRRAETIDLYFEYDSDILAVGDQYGFGMAENTNTLDTAAEATTLTLQGGALTLVFNGPNAGNVPTTATDVTLLKYSVTAASNIEIKKHEFVLCFDVAGDGTYDDITSSDLDDLSDFKVMDEDTGVTVIGGGVDGDSFTTDDSVSCVTGTGEQKNFTDVLDLTAGKTYNYKVTADINTATVTDVLVGGSIIKVVLDDYADDATSSGDVTVAKYSGTNDGVKSTDIVPSADITGPAITLTASALTLSLAGNPASQTQIRGTNNIDFVGITFAASQASALKVTSVKLTGYASDETSGSTFDEGVDPSSNDSAVSIANAVSSVNLYDDTGMLVADSSKVTNNSLATAETGTITFSNLDWNIPAGTSKTLLVRTKLSNNAASGSGGDRYAFDIAATSDVTALDADSNTVNSGTFAVNGTTTPTKIITVKDSGSMTLATSADSPTKGAIYWGQTSAPISKFRLSSTDEAQFIEKLTIAASVSTENTDAAANVKNVTLTYTNKDGQTLTKTQAFGQGASVNFNWPSDNTRPYVPKDSNLNIAVNADMKTSAEGATQTNASPQDVFFSLDLVDRFNGSFTDGFRALGEGSGTVLDGTSSNINDVVGANDQYVYKVFPEIKQVALCTGTCTYDLIGTPTVFKFSIKAMGLSDSSLRFDNEHAGSGSIKFEILASGEHVLGGSSTSYTIYDETDVIIDTATSEKDGRPATHASMTFNFTSKDVEIAGGQTKTFRVQINNPNANFSKTTGATTGRAADYFQLTLLDDEAGLVNWVANYNGGTTSVDQASTIGVLRSLPLYGPTFQR